MERRDDHVSVVTRRRVYPHADIANKHQRTDISAGQIIGSNDFAAGFHQFVDALGDRETINFG